MSITANNLRVREVINQVVNDPHYKEVSSIPVVSFPQIGLILVAYLSVLGGLALHHYLSVSLWIVYPIMIFGFYTAFTPLHDSTHRAVSSNNILNDILGTLSGFVLFPMSNAMGYRYLHLAHHRYVGDKDLDPDEPLVAIPTKYFPLGYLALLFPDFIWTRWLLKKAWKRTPSRKRFSVLFMIFGNVVFHIIWLLSPVGWEYFLVFFIPNRIAIAYTALTFAHIPHPEGLKWNDHPFQATFTLIASKFFMWSLYGQKHHSMHHFLPHIPWYKYFKVWDLANGAFKFQNIPDKEVFSKPDINFKEKVLLQQEDDDSLIEVTISEIKEAAKHIKTFTFKPSETDSRLPEFSAGAHIEVHLPSGKKRAYSLVNAPFEKDYYQIAVKREPEGNGGSKEMHELMRGQHLFISKPKNNFMLYENAQKYLLFAGGIGITPLLSMAHRLTEMEKIFELHICVKDESEIPFRFELDHWTFAPNVEVHIDRSGKSSMEIEKVIANPKDESLIYTCGPSGFNHWIKHSALNNGWTQEQIKAEVFSLDQSSLTSPKPFELTLNKLGRTIHVKQDETIIDALQLNNIEVPYSCMQGTCGTCITDVIDGEIDHRDAVLSEEEKVCGDKICLCVSRAKGSELTIDI